MDNPVNLILGETRWDEKADLRRDAVGSQVIDVLEAQEIKETGTAAAKQSRNFSAQKLTIGLQVSLADVKRASSPGIATG